MQQLLISEMPSNQMGIDQTIDRKEMAFMSGIHEIDEPAERLEKSEGEISSQRIACFGHVPSFSKIESIEMQDILDSFTTFHHETACHLHTGVVAARAVCAAHLFPVQLSSMVSNSNCPLQSLIHEETVLGSCIMLQFRLLMLTSIVLWLGTLIVAVPQLEPRQGRQGLNFFDVDWGAVGTGIFTGIGALGVGLYNWINSPNPQQSQPQPQPQPQPEQTPDTQDTANPEKPQENTMPGPAPPGTLTEPEYNLGTPPDKPKEPIHEPSSPPPLCEMTNIVSPDCGKVLDRLIFTTGCQKMKKGQVPTAIATAQNTAILAQVNSMAPGRVHTTTSDLCGVFMIVAPLTDDQSRQIETMPGVLRVTSDIFFDTSARVTKDHSLDPGEIQPAYKKRQLRKRDILRQPNAPTHLSFLSTPEDYHQVSTDYVYDSSAGEDTVVFLIGPGLEMNHLDFRYSPITQSDFIFAYDVPTTNTLVPDSFGTCVGSLIMGDEFGVSKRTKLKPVRIEDHVGSLINAMVQMGNWIGRRAGQPGNGYVMVMDVAWQNTEPETTAEFEMVMELLMYDLDVVTVVAAGEDFSRSYGRINSYPAQYSGNTPVISVGAVDLSGERFSWSRGGNERGTTWPSVTAPGSVACASNAGGGATDGLVMGTFIAAAQVAGLAAYFLAAFPRLRGRPEGDADMVKEHIISNAWARSPGGLKSIWNLMGPEQQNPPPVSPNWPY
ncbi:hypothetical protein MMC07_001201 [Pseudocyphellaria aurata]|nr:hypothetical protein [Pseudocyphellaria aurata]